MNWSQVSAGLGGLILLAKDTVPVRAYTRVVNGQEVQVTAHERGGGSSRNRSPEAAAAYDSARAEVTRMGASDGREHLVIHSADGTIIGVNSGTESSVGLPLRAAISMMWKSTQATVHHNHPNGDPLSPDDIEQLARWRGMASIVAHGSTDGSQYEASTTAEQKAMLKRLATDRDRLWRGVSRSSMKRLVEVGASPRAAAQLTLLAYNEALSDVGAIDLDVKLSPQMKEWLREHRKRYDAIRATWAEMMRKTLSRKASDEGDAANIDGQFIIDGPPLDARLDELHGYRGFLQSLPPDDRAVRRALDEIDARITAFGEIAELIG